MYWLGRTFTENTKILLALLLLYVFVFIFNGSLNLSQITRWKYYIGLNPSLPNMPFKDSNFASNKIGLQEKNLVEQEYDISVAIGLGITSKGVVNITESNVANKFQFFYTFLGSFCTTESPGFDYSFYLAYDFSDSKFSNETFRKWFSKAFRDMISKKCSSNLTASLHLVNCDLSGKPVWAQNDAMLEAYLDNSDYYFRINDDSLMMTKNWTREFIRALGQYKPSNVGVVGPAHAAGNQGILTYDFVHRTHIDVLGFYYPRTITDWWGDDWITRVYEPGRMRKLHQVRLIHTLGMGRRYGVTRTVKRTWRIQMMKDKKVLMRYIQYRNTTVTQPKSATFGRNVISMSLFGNAPRYTWGAIRNAQLAPIFFPDWKLRFYVVDPEVSDSILKTNFTVSPRVLRKLNQLGAEVKSVPESIVNTLPARFWRYVVIDDQDVDYFLIRDANSRLSERERLVVEEWLSKGKNSIEESPVLHCIRDHPSHVNRSVVEGLWGGDARKVRSSLPAETPTISETIEDFVNSLHISATDLTTAANSSMNSFVETLWQKFNLASMCHDGVSCKVMPKSVPILVPRKKNDHIGQKYDEHQEKVKAPNFDVSPECSILFTESSKQPITSKFSAATSLNSTNLKFSATTSTIHPTTLKLSLQTSIHVMPASIKR